MLLFLVLEFKLGFIVVSAMGEPLSLVLDLKLLGIPLLMDAESGVMGCAPL